MKVMLDTHIAVDLARKGDKFFTTGARRALAKSKVALISPISALEMRLLWELGKIQLSDKQILSALAKLAIFEDEALMLKDISEHSLNLSWTTDPFDRLIVAHAIALNATLLTRDGLILEMCDNAVW